MSYIINLDDIYGTPKLFQPHHKLITKKKKNKRTTISKLFVISDRLQNLLGS